MRTASCSSARPPTPDSAARSSRSTRKTGRKAWDWFAVAGPGENGHETWPKNTDAWKTGGGAVWLVGAADPDLGLVYFGTGNGVPQYAGDTRAGDNLYLCSVVALDIKTGKLRWHYQTIRHDIWEADIAESPVLFDAQVAGRPRKAIAAMRTDGYLFMLDRETGKPLMQIEERKVPQDARSHTVATQPYPVGADPVLPDCDEWRKQPMPSGFELGCFFAPASLDKPNLLTPAWGMRVGADGLQPADRLLLRDRQRVAAVVPARGGSVHLHPRRRQGARAAARPRGHGGDRQPHEQDRVEEGVSRRRGPPARWRPRAACCSRRCRTAIWSRRTPGPATSVAVPDRATAAADRPRTTRSTASSTSRSSCGTTSWRSSSADR